MLIIIPKKHIVLIVICIIVTAIFVSKDNKAILVSANLEERIVDNDKKIAYLTFDDGPSKKETEKILDILKEENVKATFFVIGKNVSKYPEIVKREYEEGHYIANHGYSHNNSKLYKSEDSFLLEVKNTDIEIGKAIGTTGYCSHIFRFPNGYMSNIYKSQKQKMVKALEQIDYSYIDWNCLNRDSETKLSNAKLIENLKKTSKGKSTLVILMHDTGDVNNTSKVLKASIEYLKENGYEFRNMYDI